MTIDKLFIVLLLIMKSLSVSAQNLSDVLFGKENKSNYMGQYNYNGKRKNGFGIERYRNGTLYIGDFSEDVISGWGMLVCKGKEVSNVAGAIVYVGNWSKGKKNGKGTCYDANGNMVYEGMFSNDKPVGKVIVDRPLSEKTFSIIDIEGNLYLGETVNNLPEGFGLTLQDDGSIVYGTVRNGLRQGIGMTFYAPKVWEVGQWVDGNYRPFNNSNKAEADLAIFKVQKKEWKKELRSDLWSAAENFAQAGLTTVSLVNDIQGKNVADAEDVAEPSPESSQNGKSTKKAKKTKKSNDCKLCYGTGICNYCDGAGWNSYGGSVVRCTACKERIGVCKRCKGTGKV